MMWGGLLRNGQRSRVGCLEVMGAQLRTAEANAQNQAAQLEIQEKTIEAEINRRVSFEVENYKGEYAFECKQCRGAQLAEERRRLESQRTAAIEGAKLT